MDYDASKVVLRDTITTMRTPKSAEDPLVLDTMDAFRRSAYGKELDGILFDVAGMSGKRYRRFISSLIANIGPDARYLEIGTHAGSTLCAAIWGNAVKAVAIDNFSHPKDVLGPNPNGVVIGLDLHANPKKHLIENLEKFTTEDAYLKLIERDFREVDFAGLPEWSEWGKFNVYLYDGPHGERDQYDGITMALPALADKFVLIVDDWNYEQVRKGTLTAIQDGNLDWRLGIDVLTQVQIDGQAVPPYGDNPYFYQASDWHNGYFIGVFEKGAAS